MKRWRQLERRVRELEDRAEIVRLMASYGPCVDSGLGQAAAGLWARDGIYDTDAQRMDGPAAITAMVGEDPHQGYIRGGSAHVPSVSAIDIEGDTAVAIGYSHLFLRAGDAFVVARASANRWEFVRTDSGWRVKVRITRLLDGSAEPRELLGQIAAARPGVPMSRDEEPPSEPGKR